MHRRLIQRNLVLPVYKALSSTGYPGGVNDIRITDDVVVPIQFYDPDPSMSLIEIHAFPPETHPVRRTAWNELNDLLIVRGDVDSLLGIQDYRTVAMSCPISSINMVETT
jgi:hypothetical protein